jgi:endonuclease/exonuclease/phosphatase (EEP) superfamily protein YafD
MLRAELLGGLSIILVGLSVGAALSAANQFHPAAGLIGSLLPYLCVIFLLLAVGFAALRAPLRSRLATAVALLCAVELLGAVAAARGSVSSQGPILRLGSFNAFAGNLANGQAIARYIATSEADVFVVMEAKPIFSYLAELQATYPYRIGCEDIASCDLAIFSRLPMLDPRVLSASKISPNRMAIVTFALREATFTLVASHLTKPYFDDHGFEEIEAVRRQIDRIKGGLVVLGDFNQASWSPMIVRFLALTGLTTVSTGLEPGTWPSSLGPWGIPIDHVFAGRGLAVAAVDAIPDPMGSNHRGLLAAIGLDRK